MFKYHVLAILLATILDFFIGDIYSVWNPFDSICKLINFLDRALLGDEIILLEPNRQKHMGMWLIFLVLLPVFTVITFFSMLFYEISLVTGVLFEVLASYLCIKGNYLYYGAKNVMDSYYGDGIFSMKNAAESYIGKEIVSEDEEKITCETITYLANETTDSLISPLLFLFLFGPVGGFLYRTIDIIDKKIGHYTNRYRYFGFYAAKINRVVSYIPGRFAGLLTVFSARHTFGDFNGKNAKYIHLRDRNKSISAFAGALGIQLKNNAIGDLDKKAKASDIRAAIRLMQNDFFIIQLILVFLLLFF